MTKPSAAALVDGPHAVSHAVDKGLLTEGHQNPRVTIERIGMTR
jgi:hypothetical protein